jgi:hypothetical protein
MSETDVEKQRTEITNAIDVFYSKYESNKYMLSKIHNYIVNQLPVVFENMENQHKERQNRIDELTQNQDQFIEYFLNNNQYFYVQTTSNFFYYDGINYQIYNEDDIIYHILSSISKERELSSWKQSTKNTIMKRIKESNILKSIPESDTIQIVIDCLCPVLFKTRTETKYFLTILGDNILRKNTNMIHYINSKSKLFIRNLNNVCQILIGQNLYQTFKHKYHDHEYKDCRILHINDFVKSETICNAIISQYGLNIICVAAHYSERYGSSDNYLFGNSNDAELNETVFYLKNNSQADIIDKFITEYINIEIPGSVSLTNQLLSIDNLSSQPRNTQITWRDMQYLWKNFLESKNLPPIMFFQTLKTCLITCLTPYYNEKMDSFIGICSKYLPEIKKFVDFWEETMIMDENETDFEIDEIILLLRKWCTDGDKTLSNLNDKQILDVISYFYPTIEIEKDKYISKIRCCLWDKQQDIQTALDIMKDAIRVNYANEKNNTPSLRHNVSIYDAYKYYCKHYSNNNGSVNKLIVSKSYFEKYVFDHLSAYIIDTKFLSSDWYTI